MAHVEMNTGEPAVETPAVRKNSVRNVLIATGILAGTLFIARANGVYFNLPGGVPFGALLALALVALFARSFWDVLVTRGVAARTGTVGAVGLYGLWIYGSAIVFYGILFGFLWTLPLAVTGLQYGEPIGIAVVVAFFISLAGMIFGWLFHGLHDS